MCITFPVAIGTTTIIGTIAITGAGGHAVTGHATMPVTAVAIIGGAMEAMAADTTAMDERVEVMAATGGTTVEEMVADRAPGSGMTISIGTAGSGL